MFKQLFRFLTLQLEVKKFKDMLVSEAIKLWHEIQDYAEAEVKEHFLNKFIPVGTCSLGELGIMITETPEKPLPLLFRLFSASHKGKRIYFWGGIKELKI